MIKYQPFSAKSIEKAVRQGDLNEVKRLLEVIGRKNPIIVHMPPEIKTELWDRYNKRAAQVLGNL